MDIFEIDVKKLKHQITFSQKFILVWVVSGVLKENFGILMVCIQPLLVMLGDNTNDPNYEKSLHRNNWSCRGCKSCLR